MKITRGDYYGFIDPITAGMWVTIPVRGQDGEHYSVLLPHQETRLRRGYPSVVAATKVLLYWGPLVGQWP